jgi:tetratricopeptide (TPR) repeat protein
MARCVGSWSRSAALILCVLIVATTIGVPAAAQDSADYDRLVSAYAAGHLSEAVAVLGRWPRENVSAAVRGLESMSRTGPGAPARLPAAVMLHTDLAAAVSGTDGGLSDFHLGLARRLVDLMVAKKEKVTGAQEFAKRWYEFAPSLYLASRELEKAFWLVQDGLVRSPGDPMLYLFSGTIIELRGPIPTTVITRSRGFGTAPGPPERQLEAAANLYRRALGVDSHFAAARLRLGWIHVQQRDSRARAEIEAALADATDIPTQYVAHLFLGTIAERNGRFADALDQYEQARAIGPAYQTAYVAVCRTAEALGDVERAQRTAAAFVGIEKREDPWWDYHLGGLNMPALEWLRAVAQTP